jgi:hypothetical protein
MRGVQRIGDLRTEIERLGNGQRPFTDSMPQRFSIEQFHDDEPLAMILADVEQRADVRVIQRRSDARLALKALERVAISGQLRRQQLERHLPPEPRVFGSVDDSHAAVAELFDDAVVRQGLADHGSEVYPRVVSRSERVEVVKVSP